MYPHKYGYILLAAGAGLLFEAHVVMFGSYATDRLYRSASHRMKEGKQEKLSADSSEEIILREKKHFWFRTFSALNHMTNVAKRQQFELSLVLDSRGLSDTGRDLLSKFDMGVSHGAFLEYRRDYLAKADQHIK